MINPPGFYDLLFPGGACVYPPYEFGVFGMGDLMYGSFSWISGV